MPKVYSRAPDELVDRAKHLMKCFHQPLIDAGLTIDFLSVAWDDPENDKPPLTLHGVACAAVVRVVGSKDRAKGHADCEIVVDESRWITRPPEEKEAILDHELYHIELKRDKKKRLKLDANGRPSVKLKPHDYDLGHFVEIAKRHGSASLEVKQMTRVFLTHKQDLFDFALGESTRLALDAALAPSGEPSAKVREIADEILNAEPSVQLAARNLVAHLREHNATMTIKSGGKTTVVE